MCIRDSFNTGSHAELGNLEKVVDKKSIDLILFYLCNMQCCMATVDQNMSKTEDQVIDVVSLVKSMKNTEVIFGGSGLSLMPNLHEKIDLTFDTFSDLKSLVDSIS